MSKQLKKRLKRFPKKISKRIKWSLIGQFKPKIFCIGINKTGTTSLEAEMKYLGYKVDNQNKAHKLMWDYEQRNFNAITKHCRNAEFFQDSPFSMKHTFYFLYNAYPKAKFILTVRSSSEEWYNSFLRFQSKQFGTNGNIPTIKQLKSAKRPHGRTVYDNLRMRFGTSDDDIYKKEDLINYYNTHNKEVIDFFRLIPNKLFVLNLAEPNIYLKFCDFLGITPKRDGFPHLNKSQQNNT